MTEQVALIDENLCVGCTKCINACPFDAIIGCENQMHTVLETECVGCKLCIAPCPVDCISMMAIPTSSKPVRMAKAKYCRERYNARNIRLETQAAELQQKQAHYTASSKQAKQDFIAQAIERAKKR